MLERRTDFVVYCIEEYKYAEKLTGRQVFERFRDYGVLDYIRANYNALHTTGGPYIVEDINLYIGARAMKQ